METGGFRAKGLMKTHNWFAFRPNGRGHQAGKRRGYGVYPDTAHTLRDYQEWETQTIRRYGLYSESAFRAWLPGHYATDPQYGQKIDQALTLIHQHE